ncbi:MAG: C_GCAxxG_C_C family protein [Prolixibacteraceae bacterium]|nr:C_GCAxxG_C_C family protein [Prolixibacteraceae bacterium]MBN2773351.1 C_GCAxxG_C_C family protein [Prolixibacteraceae bacterium]
MTEKTSKIDEIFPGFNCCQTVFSLFAPEIGLDENTALKIASGFGGGMACAETCGAVTGSYMVIGYKHGNANSDPDAKANTKSLIKKFNEKFITEQGSLICKKLIGYDISKPEEAEAASEAGAFLKKCPLFIKTACKILEEDF